MQLIFCAVNWSTVFGGLLLAASASQTAHMVFGKQHPHQPPPPCLCAKLNHWRTNASPQVSEELTAARRLATLSSNEALPCVWKGPLHVGYIYKRTRQWRDAERGCDIFSTFVLLCHSATETSANLLSVIFCRPRTSSGVITVLASRSSSVVTGTPRSVELQPFFTFIAAVCFGLPLPLSSVPPGLLPAGFLALDGSWLLPLLVQE